MPAHYIRPVRAEHNQIACYSFFRVFEAEPGDRLEADLFASTRYKLYLNGTLMAVGPLKASEKTVYYDHVSLNIDRKINRLEIRVLQLPASEDVFVSRRKLTSVIRMGDVRMAFDGLLRRNGFTCAEICSDDTWKAVRHGGFSLIDPPDHGFVAMNERIDFSQTMTEEDTVALAPFLREGMPLAYGEENYPRPCLRPVPQMLRKDHALSLKENGIYDAGELTTGYLRLKAKGKGSIRVTYAESFFRRAEDGTLYKDVRDDFSGEIVGDTDEFLIDGTPVNYETYWFRAFRFLKVVTTGSAEVEELSCLETRYPFEPLSCDFGRADDNRLYELCLHTLALCQHETFEDCPYYEQLQYVMDTALQVKYTLLVSPDRRLAKKALLDFAASQTVEGLLGSRTPSSPRQYIPTFSLFFVEMLSDYLDATGDVDFVTSLLPVAERIFQYFLSLRRGDGLIGRKPDFWDFVDWTQGYDFGVPPVKAGEPLIAQTLMTSYYLQKAAALFRRCGDREVPDDFEFIARELNGAAIRHGKKDGLFSDGPKTVSFSQPTQIWAVLAGACVEDAAEVMRRSFTLPRATFAYGYFLCRALEKAGVYELSEEMTEKLRRLPEKGCTTIPEKPDRPRSECHAWGANPVYEFVHGILAVESVDALKKTVTLDPGSPTAAYWFLSRTHVKGTIPCGDGTLTVTRSQSGISWHLDAPGWRVAVKK